MDKTKQSPIPDKTTTAMAAKKPVTSDPTFIRGTIDPTTKKEK